MINEIVNFVKSINSTLKIPNEIFQLEEEGACNLAQEYVIFDFISKGFYGVRLVHL